MLALATAAVLVASSVAESGAAAVRVDPGIELVGCGAAVGTLCPGRPRCCRTRSGVSVVVTGCVGVATANCGAWGRTVISVTVDTGVGGVGSAACVCAVCAFRSSGRGGGAMSRGHRILYFVDHRRHIGLCCDCVVLSLGSIMKLLV